MKFPEHKAGLSLTHNMHKGAYLTVAQSIEDGDFGFTEECWISEAERLRAIETDDCWTIQWYPNTPIGFYLASAHSLEALLAYASEGEDR